MCCNISNTSFVLPETIHSPMVASSSISSGNYLYSYLFVFENIAYVLLFT